MPFRVFILMGLLMPFQGMSQSNHDFDADSVLYTPIPKPSVTSAVRQKSSTETSEKGRFKYFIMLKSGSLSGDKISFTTAIVQGITLTPQFRAGLGLGFDSYWDVSTVPLFVNTSFDLSRKKNALFLAFNGGVSKVWNHDYYYYVGQSLRDFSGGYMVNPEVGYRIRYHDLRIGLSVGWKTQRIKYHYENYYNGYWDPVNGWMQGEPSTTTVKENMRRIALNLFIGWK